MSTLAIGTMVLAGAMSTGGIPLEFKSIAHANGAWVTAADVVRAGAHINQDLRDKLSQVRLRGLHDCQDVLLSRSDTARRIVRQLPGVFALQPGEFAGTALRVEVQGQTLSGDRLTADIERSLPRTCPPSVREPCVIRLTRTPEALCVPKGQVVLRSDVAEVAELASHDAPLQIRVGIFVDDVHVTTLRLPATATNGFWALQLKHKVEAGQAIRLSDVEPVQVSAPLACATRYDVMKRVVRAASDLAAGAIVSADVAKFLASARAHEPMMLSTRVGPVQVSRSARLASDVGQGSTTWGYFDSGGLVAIRPTNNGVWELIR